MDHKKHRGMAWLILTIVYLFIDITSSQTTPACTSVLRGRGETIVGYNLRKDDVSKISPLSELAQGTWCPQTGSTERWLDIKLGTPWAVNEIKMSEIATGVGAAATTLTIAFPIFQPLNDNDALVDRKQQMQQTGQLVTNPLDSTSSTFSRTLTLTPARGSRRLWIQVGAEHNNCFTLEFRGCPSHELCPAGCDNRALCSMPNNCTCANGWGGDMCDLQQAPLPAFSDVEPLGMEDGRIKDAQLKVSSNAQDKTKARLGCCYDDDEGAWCPDPNDNAPYFEVEFAQPTQYYAYRFNFPTTHFAPTAIIERKYMMTFDMSLVLANGQQTLPQESVAASSEIETIIARLPEPLDITKFRITPKRVIGAACFRFEIYKKRIVQSCNPPCPQTAECTAGVCVCRQGYIGTACDITKSFVIQRQHILTFLRIELQTVITPSLTFATIGTPQLIPGRFGNALLLNGRDTYIKLQQTDLEFLTGTQTVERGFTIKLDVNIISLRHNTYILTNGGDLPTHSGISIVFQTETFVVTVSTTTQKWQITVPAARIPVRTWQTLQLTWSQTTGLEFFVNRDRIAVVTTPTPRPTPSTNTAEISIGFPSMIIPNVAVNHAHILVENIKIWEVQKTVLEELKIVPSSCPQECQHGGLCITVTGVCECNAGFTGIACQVSENTLTTYTISYNLIEQLRVDHRVEVTVVGSPQIISNQVIVLNQPDQHITITTPGQCFRNIELCFTGFTVSVDVEIIQMPEPGDTLVIVSPAPGVVVKPGVSIYVESNTLIAVVQTTRQEWRVEITNFVPVPSKPTNLMYSWSLETGLLVYINNVLSGTTTIGTRIPATPTPEYTFTIGGTVTTIGTYPVIQIGNVVTWSTTSIGLQELGLLEVKEMVSPPTREPTSPITTVVPTTTRQPTTSEPTPVATTVALTTPPTSPTSTTSEQTPVLTTDAITTTEHRPDTTTAPHTILLEWNLTSFTPTKNVLTLVNGVELKVEGAVNVTSTELIFSGNEPHRLVVQNLPLSHCLNSLIICNQGFTIQLGVLFQSLLENTILISTGGEVPNTPGIAMVYRYGSVHVIVSTTTHTWYATIPDPPQINQKYDYVISWALNQKLRVYVQNILVVESVTPVIQQNINTISVNGVYFLSSIVNITSQQIFHGAVHILRIWELERTHLEIEGLIDPAESTTAGPVASTEAPIISPTQPPVTCPTPTPTVCPTEPPVVCPTETPVCPTQVPLTCPTELPPGTCPPGCISVAELNNTAAPDPPRNPVVITETYENGLKARFVCTFERNPGPAVVTAVTWVISGVRLSRQLVGTASRAVLEPTDINMESTYGKTVCCEVQSVTSGVCGDYSSVAIRSLQCIELRMTLLTNTLRVTEGQTTAGLITINFAMHPYLLCVQRFGSTCQVAIQTVVAESVRHNSRCPGGNSVPQLVIISQGIDCGRVIGSTITVSGNVTVQVQATIDGVIDSLKRPQVEVSCITYSETITSQTVIQTLGTVQVSVANGDRRATCSSTGDPHVKTFDGFAYNSFLEGEFVVYQHKTLPYAVHADHRRCSSRNSATCICKVAVKSGDDVFLFTGCQSRRRGNMGHRGRGNGRPVWFMSIDLYTNGALTEGTKIMRMGTSSKYEVVLPTGTVVTVLLINGGFMNLWVTASAVDYQQSLGLCGLYDAVRSNDLMGGGSNPVQFTARSRAQNTFSNTWKISTSASIYTGVQVDTTLTTSLPFADCRPAIQTRRLGQGLPVVRCSRPSGTDVTATIVQSAKTPISPQNRRKRQADNEPIDLDAPLDEANLTVPMNVSRAYCEKLVGDSTVASNCKEIMNVPDFSEQVQNCADDYSLSGDPDWGASHLSDILEQCTSAIQNSEELSDDTNTNTAALVRTIQADSCLVNCGANGTCHDSVCICDDGFSGETCSISRDTQPDVDAIPRDSDPCDTDTGAQCIGVIITGSDFVESDSLTCHIKYVKVGVDSVEPIGDESSNKADFISENLVQCELPKRQSAYISISNDGETLSNSSFLHVVYDQRCRECQYNIATNELEQDSASCKDKNVCIIGEICYAVNELNSEDNCKICDPSISKTDWTRRNTPECTKKPIVDDTKDDEGLTRKEKIIMAVVIPIVGVAIIVVIAFICYKKSKSAQKKKKHSQMYHKSEQNYETGQVNDGYESINSKTESASL